MINLNIQPSELQSTIMGQSLLLGRLTATVENHDGTHTTLKFKAWKRGERNVSLFDATKVFIEVPNRGSGWYGDKVAAYEPNTGIFQEDRWADSERADAAIKVLEAAAGRRSDQGISKSSLCFLCGKELTDPESKTRGIGPVCYGKVTDSSHQAKERPATPHVPVEVPVEKIDFKNPFQLSIDEGQFKIEMPKEAAALRAEIKGSVSVKFDWNKLAWFAKATKANAEALKDILAKHDFEVSGEAAETLASVESAPYGAVDLRDERFVFLYDHDFSEKATAIKDEIKAISGSKFEKPTWSVPADPDSFAGLDAFYWAHGDGETKFIWHEAARARLEELNREAAELEKTRAELEATSDAADTDVDFQVPEGLSLWGFQKAGIDYALKAERTFIGDEMGLGKTVQALITAEEAGAYPLIVVTKEKTKRQFAQEALKWCPRRSVKVLYGVEPRTDKDGNAVTADTRMVKSAALNDQGNLRLTKNGSIYDADIIVINYEILAAHEATLKLVEAQAIVGDESAEKIRSKGTKKSPVVRTRVFLDLCKDVRKRAGLVLLLTGTPIVNSPFDFITQLEALDRLHEFGGWKGFVDEYIGYEYKGEHAGWVVNRRGAKNKDKLNRELRKRCFVRRRLHDVLEDLPERIRSIVPVELSNPAEYARVEDDTSEPIVKIGKLRQAIGRGKVDAVGDWVDTFLADDGSEEKLILFAHHHEVQDALMERFPNSADFTYNNNSPTKMGKAEQLFWNDPACRVAICSLEAMQSGVNLQCASSVAFVEFGWTPTVHDQAEARASEARRRLSGMEDRGTHVYYFLASESFDEDMAEVLDVKRENTTEAVEGREVAEAEITRQLLAKMAKRSHA